VPRRLLRALLLPRRLHAPPLRHALLSCRRRYAMSLLRRQAPFRYDVADIAATLFYR